MSYYVITGVLKGLGFEFLRQLSAKPNNTVIGIVRDKLTTIKKISKELEGRSNIHILQADILDYEALKITGGSLDYLIANAGYVSLFDVYDPIGVLGQRPQELEDDLLKSLKTNIVANVHLVNLYIPLILKGRAKKVITLTSGHADLDCINQYELDLSALYSISKAGMNAAVGKFHAQYKKEGVLFISISPGLVDTGHHHGASPEQLQKVGGMMQKFKQYAPDFAGPITAEASVRDVITVWERASVENGDGGTYVSHKGDKKWI